MGNAVFVKFERDHIVSLTGEVKFTDCHEVVLFDDYETWIQMYDSFESMLEEWGPDVVAERIMQDTELMRLFEEALEQQESICYVPDHYRWISVKDELDKVSVTLTTYGDIDR